LGEFLPFKRLFILDNVLKIKVVAQKFWLLVSSVDKIWVGQKFGRLFYTRIWSPGSGITFAQIQDENFIGVTAPFRFPCHGRAQVRRVEHGSGRVAAEGQHQIVQRFDG
jgi:hypothetical protein